MRLSGLGPLPPVWSAHGLTFAQAAVAEADVRITFCAVSPRLDAPRHVGRHVDIGRCEWLLRLDPATRVYAREGVEILVDAPTEAHVEEIVRWVLGPATVAILYQRGLTPLHASAVGVDGGIVAFLGPAGSGKSSLAAAALAKGARFVTDDVLTVTTTAGGAVGTFPGPRLLRLSAETAGHVSREPLEVTGTTRDGKLLARPLTAASPLPGRLTAAFLLGQGETVVARRVVGGDLFTRLRSLLQRPGLASVLGAAVPIFETLGTFTREVPVWELGRPRVGWSMPACMKCVRCGLQDIGVTWGGSGEQG